MSRLNGEEVYMSAAIDELAIAIGELPRRWWVVGLRGLAALIFGILALVWPGVTLAVLILLFGAYAIVDGVLTLYSALRAGGKHVWALLFEGVIGVLAGIIAFVWPGLTALALLFVIAAWAILTGILEMYTAVRMREVITNEWELILAGILSIIFGVLLAVQPGVGVLALVWLIGIYGIIFGIAMLGLAWRLHGTLARSHGATPGIPRTRAA
jgi:uncharacterized membrane protein HdeD (DUF308 family)